MSSTRAFSCLAAFFVLGGILLSGYAWAADPVFPPGSRIGLVPPPDMVASEGIAGFRDPKTGAAIATIEMPAEAYQSMAAGFTEEALKTQGFTLKSRETVTVGGHEAVLISGDQVQGDVTVPKSVLLSADAGMTALVIAQSPPGAPAGDEAKLKDALKTVVFRAPLSMDQQLAALPFTFGDLAGFRPVRVMAGNSVMLTKGPSDGIQAAEQPIMIVAQSLAGAPPPEQRAAVARELLTANTFLDDTTLERSQSFRQNGSEWHELVAKAKDRRSGAPVVVQQTIRFVHAGYIRMVGIVKADDRDGSMPLFRRIADSVAPK
jgi:hypothetical protein